MPATWWSLMVTQVTPSACPEGPDAVQAGWQQRSRPSAKYVCHRQGVDGCWPVLRDAAWGPHPGRLGHL